MLFHQKIINQVEFVYAKILIVKFYLKNIFGNQLIQGINNVETKYFCIFNADGSFDPIYLSQLKNKILLNQDFVFCSRYEAWRIK